jgi:acetyl-CoA C-acetyltransferase
VLRRGARACSQGLRVRRIHERGAVFENLGFCEPGEGWKLTEAGVTALDGDLRINPSGGVLCTNPIGASGMLRFAEAALQVRGMAGDHQIDGARKALGHAYGGGSQFFALWIVGSDKP